MKSGIEELKLRRDAAENDLERLCEIFDSGADSSVDLREVQLKYYEVASREASRTLLKSRQLSLRGRLAATAVTIVVATMLAVTSASAQDYYQPKSPTTVSPAPASNPELFDRPNLFGGGKVASHSEGVGTAQITALLSAASKYADAVKFKSGTLDQAEQNLKGAAINYAK